MESNTSTSIMTTMPAMSVNTTIPPTDWFKFDDPAQRIFVAILFIIASIVGVVGNSVVIAAVIVSRRLRTITNVFVVNLAVADLLTSAAVPWNAVALLSPGGWPLQPWVCSVAGGIMYLCIAASLYSLASVALNRFILVTKDFKTYRRTFTTVNLVIWVGLIWVVSFIFVLFLPIIDIGALGYNRKYHSCGQTSDHPKEDTYQLLQAFGIFPIPLTIICYCYGRLFCFVRRHAKVMSAHLSVTQETTQSDLSNETGDHSKAAAAESKGRQSLQVQELSEVGQQQPTQEKVHLSSASDCQNGSNHANGVPAVVQTNNNNSIISRSSSVFKKRGASVNKRQLQITQNMFIVVCAFFVCLAPFTVCLFYDDSDPFVPYACAIVLCNSCINPFIYATKHPVFKTVMKAVVTCRLRNVPEPTRVIHRLVINKTSLRR
ncbi:beta-4C adrenergic receptor-like [Diadema antillarum]|uniref:beta-4C adrenergic receptor-like n=1 Tax=Diadema antillarum TaxID=105358 RepID=UPI003A859921